MLCLILENELCRHSRFPQSLCSRDGRQKPLQIRAELGFPVCGEAHTFIPTADRYTETLPRRATETLPRRATLLSISAEMVTLGTALWCPFQSGLVFIYHSTPTSEIAALT